MSSAVPPMSAGALNISTIAMPKGDTAKQKVRAITTPTAASAVCYDPHHRIGNRIEQLGYEQHQANGRWCQTSNVYEEDKYEVAEERQHQTRSKVAYAIA